MKSPSFQFYASDFLVGIMGMTDEEVGVYIKMLALQWVKDGLPTDPKAIKTAINSRKIPSENVLRKFIANDDGTLRNERLELERQKQENFRASRAENASKRWGKRCTSNARASGSIPGSTCKTDALLTSSSDTPISPEGDGGKILEIAGLYPKQSHQRETLEAIEYAIRQGHAPEVIRRGTIAIAEKLNAWPSGARNQFAPSPPKFFRDFRFLDDPATWVRETEKKQAWQDDPTHRPY